MVYKIGISNVIKNIKVGDKGEVNYFKVNSSYIKNLIAIGKQFDIEILPVLISHDLDMVDFYAKELDGVILTGGDLNVNPDFYTSRKPGKPTVIEESLIDKSGRIEFDILLAQKFLHAGKSILGICLGMQIMNVAAGGTLCHVNENPYQSCIFEKKDNPKEGMLKLVNGETFESRGSNNVIHYEEGNIHDAFSIFHDVHFITNSVHNDRKEIKDLNKKLEKSLPVEILRSVKTNSAHSFCVNTYPDSFIPTAFTNDGIIESFQAKDHPFAVGVQWHPEIMSNITDLELKDYNPIYHFLEKLK